MVARKRLRRKKEKLPFWRTIVPKAGVFIHVHVKKTRRGRKTEAGHIRRTKARARATGKPRLQRI
jgi:hypothetical protein